MWEKPVQRTISDMRMLASTRALLVLALASVLTIGMPVLQELAAVSLGPCGAVGYLHDQAGGKAAASHDHAAGQDCQGGGAMTPTSVDCFQMPGCVMLPMPAAADLADSTAPARTAVGLPAGDAWLAGRTIPPDLSPPIVFM